MHVICCGPDSPLGSLRSSYHAMLDRAPEHAQSMKKAHAGAAHCQVYIMETRLPRSTWILQTSYVMWKSSSTCGVKLEVFRDPGFGNVSGEWTGFDVDVNRFFFVHTHYYVSHWSLFIQGTDDPNRDWRGLMIPYWPSKWCSSFELLVDGVSMKFSYATNGIKVSTHTFDTLLESYKNRPPWGTTVTLQTPRTSAAKETSLLTSSHFLWRRTLPKGSTKYLQGMSTRERTTL